MNFSIQRIKRELVSPTKNFSKIIIFSFHYLIGIFKNKKGNGSGVRVIWDIRRESITYDFTCFILNAFNTIKNQGHDKFELIIYFPKDFNPEPFKWKDYNLVIDSRELAKRVKSIIYDLAISYSCISKVKKISNLDELKELIQNSQYVFPLNYHPVYYQPYSFNYRNIHSCLMNKKDYKIPKIIPNKSCSSDMNNIFKDLQGENFITLTLRDYGFSTFRNTNNNDVIQSTKLANKLGLKLVIIPDEINKLKNYPISEDSLICFSARKYLKDRIYLYSKSNLNIFQTSGPAWVSIFIEGSKTLMVDAGKGGYDNDENHWRKDLNVRYGDQPYKDLEGYLMWYRDFGDYNYIDLLYFYKKLN
tara:strand:+ start:274 stop:1353 length:1080 start_codon:yes stop_codon:yes gene_type:complete